MKFTLSLTAAALATCGALAAWPAHAQDASPQGQVDALEGLFGKHAGTRRSGAKGICASGHFVGSADARALSSAVVFNGARVPVIARFSIGGGNARASDKSRSVRGLALQFNAPNGEFWQMANISAPVFFVSRPEQFAAFLRARTPDPATGKPDAERLKAFNEANPETLLQAAYLAKAPIPASYAGVSYWGANAFEFTNAAGQSQFVRWQFVPEAGQLGLSEEQLKTLPDDFLAAELRQRVATSPVAFDLRLQIAEGGDPITDPTRVWPDSRRTVSAGRLVIDKVATDMGGDMGGDCERITFNPLVLPAGIKPSADPVLLARPAPYGISLGRRLGEKTQ